MQHQRQPGQHFLLSVVPEKIQPYHQRSSPLGLCRLAAGNFPFYEVAAPERVRFAERQQQLRLPFSKPREPAVAVGRAAAPVACAAAAELAWEHRYQPFAFDLASGVAEVG